MLGGAWVTAAYVSLLAADICGTVFGCQIWSGKGSCSQRIPRSRKPQSPVWNRKPCAVRPSLARQMSCGTTVEQRCCCVLSLSVKRRSVVVLYVVA